MSLRDSYQNVEDLVRPHLSSKKDRHPIHKLFSYPAKFQGYLPHALISRLTQEGDLICDPFSGGGTTAATASLLGRDCYSIDLNPIAVLVSKAKTTKLGTAKLVRLMADLDQLKPQKKRALLSDDEWTLIGRDLGEFVESVWSYLMNEKRSSIAPVIGTLLIKRIKLACARDKVHLRTAPFKKHIEYMIDQLKAVELAFRDFKDSEVKIDHGSNHDMNLKNNSVSLIVTSPPYPGVDVEYNLIQLQRRDLNRCYRSDIGIRIADGILGRPSNVSKKDLCDGGNAGDYWTNSKKSLMEMKRVLKVGSLAFVRFGFKSDLDKLRYEKLAKETGFSIEDSFVVELGKERVASGRGLFHGRDTAMMSFDQLYVLRKI